MNIELISSLARIRSGEMLQAAAVRRLLVRGYRPGSALRPRLRLRLARMIRSMGYLALRLGDSLAGSR